MLDQVTVRTLGGNRVEAGNGRHRLVLDLPVHDGGAGEAMGPHEALLSALGACTSMTLLLYARRKTWPLEGVEIALGREKAPVGVPDGRERIQVDLRLHGPLDEEQRARLLDIAKKCPVYRSLTSDIDLVERLVP